MDQLFVAELTSVNEAMLGYAIEYEELLFFDRYILSNILVCEYSGIPYTLLNISVCELEC